MIVIPWKQPTEKPTGNLEIHLLVIQISQDSKPGVYAMSWSDLSNSWEGDDWAGGFIFGDPCVKAWFPADQVAMPEWVK